MNIQAEVQKIHAQFGITEVANYKIQQLFDQSIAKAIKAEREKIDCLAKIEMSPLLRFYSNNANYNTGSKVIKVLEDMHKSLTNSNR